MLSSQIQSSDSKEVRWQLFNEKSAYSSVNNVVDVHTNGGSTEGIRATRPEREKHVPALEATEAS